MENDSYLAMLMLFQLTRAGFDTDVVRTGKEGLALVQTEQFDLIAFDLDLPEATRGLNLYRKLKHRCTSRKIPVLFISGSACVLKIGEADKGGIVDCLTKPFAISELICKALNCLNPQKQMFN